MDPPLLIIGWMLCSAVDSHVGKALFRKCIMGLLSGKTRVLVTHQLQFVPFANHVVVMEEGNIVEQGTFADLMSNGNFSPFPPVFVPLLNAADTEEHLP
mgnify:FL=1